MKKEGGVFTVPCSVNGLNLRFIFDTGASDVSISLTEALFMLKNGYLKSEDILDKQNFTDATGKVSVGRIINLRKIDFSGLTLYNVKASIVEELSAPLLLGQSAMSKLGRFIFDPINGKLTILNNNQIKSDQQVTINKVEGDKKPAAATNQAKPTQSGDGLFVEFETAKGKILVRLEYQKAPITVANFVVLAEGKQTFVADEKLKGKPFYDGLKFHRVIKDFMIQGGDPAGNGSGGPGYSFKDEIVPGFVFDKAGILAMANSGPATNGSQFFITHKDTPWLNGKHTIFGYVVTGQNVVDAIAQDDVMKKVTIIRKGAAAKAFDAVKVFGDYYANKAEDDKKQVAIEAEAKAKKAAADAEVKKAYDMKYAPVKAEKVKQLAEVRKTATKATSGLEYAVIKKGTDKKPADGSNIYVHYAGYLEDGSLFDSSYEEVNKTYGKFDENRAKQNGYQPFPFQAGRKDGLIPGFLEGISNMNIGDKAVFFIPSNLGYGERGAGGVIPPNANIIFEVEIFDAIPGATNTTTEKK